MNLQTLVPGRAIDYPEDDGNPLSDNTLQYEYIVTTRLGLDDRFADDANVFVAANLLWYPVQGNNTIRQAPDVMVAFGRPKGYRGSYRQWEEDNVAPQVVFEILSPSNRPTELLRKGLFYERYGVQEYYLYDPDDGRLEGWRLENGGFVEIAVMQGWVSPLLQVRFEVTDGELQLFFPNGRQFATYEEHVRRGRQLEFAMQQAEQEKLRAEVEKQRADQAEQRAEKAEARQREQEDLVERLRAHLKSLGIDPPI